MKLNDSNQNILSLQERIRQLQRALTTGEHDKRVLEERLDTLKMSQTEGKKANDGLAERCRALQNEIHDAEVLLFYFSSKLGIFSLENLLLASVH